MSGIEIAGHRIANGARPFLIAEIAQAHDGSLGMAHAYIDAVAEAGLDAIKFQTHIAAAESTLDEPFRVKFSKQDETRYAYWKRMEFTREQWAGLADHARAAGLVFLSSAFSTTAVEWLAAIGMPAWKIGSGEFWSGELLSAMRGTGAPLLVSTGMAAWAEIESVATDLKEAEYPFALFQCTSMYPSALESVGLNVVAAMHERFGCPTGLSDHTASVVPPIVAMARGAALIEFHVTMSRAMFGPDVVASLTLEEAAEVARARDAIVAMDANPVDKDMAAEGFARMRSLFTKSLALVADQPAGTVLTRAMLTTKKPAGGIPLEEVETVVGRTLAVDKTADRLLRREDLRGDA